MYALSSSITTVKTPQTQFLSGSALKPMGQCFLKCRSIKLSSGSTSRGKAKLTTCNKLLIIQAGYSEDGGRLSSGSIFIGGFVLGGLVVGALGCVYAPQISKAIAGADKNDLMRKLPKFMYDEGTALEKTRTVLSDKIAPLNSVIDEVSAQLWTDEAPNESLVSSDEVEASV